MNPPFSPGAVTTPGGHRADAVVSALVKSIRRGRAADAMFWASELDLAGFGAWAMRRCLIAASEDAYAWHEGPAVIRALADSFAEARKREKEKEGVGDSVLFLLQATALLADAPKSRLVDDAAVVLYSEARRNAGTLTSTDAELESLLALLPLRGGWPPPIPEYALDEHTAEGRRRRNSSYDESYRLENESPEVPNAWHAAARHIDGAPPRAHEPLEAAVSASRGRTT